MYGSEHWRLPTIRIVRYAFRMDGFASVNAGYSGGEFVTEPFLFSGNELELNYSTSAVGSIRVGIQDVEGRPQAGFTLDDCPEIYGDAIAGAVAWAGGGLNGLANRPARLHFRLADADLFAFKFNE